MEVLLFKFDFVDKIIACLPGCFEYKVCFVIPFFIATCKIKYMNFNIFITKIERSWD